MKTRKLALIIPLLTLIAGCNDSSLPNTSSSSSVSSTESISTSETSSTTESTTNDSSLTSEEEKMDITDCNTTEQIDEYKQKGYTPVFKDTNFKKGFQVSKTFYDEGENPNYVDKKINFYKLYPDVNNYDWHIAQWSSKYDLMANNGYKLSSDKTGLINTITGNGKTVDGKYLPSKELTFNSMTGGISLTLNASTEYDEPRKNGEPWVHLLLENGTPRVNGNLVRLNDYKEIIMEANYTVTKCEDKMNGKANPNLHAAQLVWYVTIQNRNSNSKEYGRYIWFGLNLFDNRHQGKSTSLYNQLDKGTNTGIYSLPSSEYLSSVGGKIPYVNQPTQAKIDLKKYALDAFNISKKQGYFEETTFDEIYIGGGNFGYENPGTYDISTDFESINIFVK